MKDKVFVSITNKQIYNELTNFKNDNATQHQLIMDEIAGYKSQVLNFKLALGGISLLAMSTLGFLVSHLLNK